MEIESTKYGNPDQDQEVKRALWQAICRLADQFRSQWGMAAYLSNDHSEPVSSTATTPNCSVWKLVEILSVFTVLRDADIVRTAEVFNLRGRITTPIFYLQGGEPYYLWTQRRMKESLSGFTGIPDIIITTTDETPSRANALDIIEAKSGRRITGALIRSEFAKAYDLKVTSYFIWSFYDPSPSVIQGAKLLGIEVAPLGFGSSQREKLLEPEALLSRFAEQLRSARQSGTFERVLRQTGNDATSKRQQRLR